MKTVLIAHNYMKKSFAGMSYFLAQHLVACGYRVVFLSYEPKGLEPIVTDNLIVLPWPGGKRPNRPQALWFYLKVYFRYRPQLLVGHFVGAIFPSIVNKLFTLGKAKNIYVYHTITDAILLDGVEGRSVNTEIARKGRFYRRFIDQIVTPSKAGEADYKKYYPAKPVKVVHNGYIPAEYTKDVELAYRKKELTFIGRIDNCKGIDVLLEGFMAYLKKEPDTDLSLNIVAGGNKLDAYKQQYKSEHIRFLGRVDYEHIPDAIGASFFVVAPSIFDNLPTVGIEAMSFQTPVIASNRGGWPEIVTDGVNGYMVPPDADALSVVFGKVSKLSLAEYRRLCDNSLKKFGDCFTVEKYVLGMEAIIRAYLP